MRLVPNRPMRRVLARHTLSGTGLADDATSPSLRYPEPLFEGYDGSPAAIRG
jgi:hypothetical protein